MKECTKNITTKKFDKTFFIDREKKTIKVRSASALEVIDNFNLEKDNVLGQGSFNIVKEFPLGDKCEEKDKSKEVAVRMRTLKLGTDIMKQSNTNASNASNASKTQNTQNSQRGGIHTIQGQVSINTSNTSVRTPSVLMPQYKLSPIIIDSMYNLVELSKANLHPKVYEIKVIEHKGQYVLVIVMEKYQSDLVSFLEKHRSTLSKDIHHEINVKNKVWPTPHRNNEILIQLQQKTIDLVERISNKGYFCYDIKPGNLVVNYDIEKQTVDIRMIDVDADFCIKDLLVQSKEHSKDGKKFTKLSFTRPQIYKNGMLALLAQHLYRSHDFNYLSNYFFGLNTITKTIDKYLTIEEKFKSILFTIDEAADHELAEKHNNYDKYYLGDLTDIINHYFFTRINNNFVYNLLFINRGFKLKNRMGFGLKHLVFMMNKKKIAPYFKSNIQDIIQKQKDVEAIAVEPNEKIVDILPEDKQPPSEPKDTPIKRDKKYMEYKQEHESSRTSRLSKTLRTRPSLSLPEQPRAESKGGRYKTKRKLSRTKRGTRKAK